MANSYIDADEPESNIYLRVALLGFVTGLRSMTPLALLSWTRHIGVDTESAISQVFDAPTSRAVTSLLAVGEILGDKLPLIPSRVSTGPLLGRVAIGALAGATLTQHTRVSPFVGAAIAAAAASAGAVSGYYGRKTLSRVKRVPSFVWAGLEDSIALGLGYLATRKPE